MPLIGILIIPTRGNCISAFLYQMLLFLKVFYLMHGGAKVLLLCIIDRENNGSTLCLNVRFDDRAAQVWAVLCIGHRACLSMHRRFAAAAARLHHQLECADDDRWHHAVGALFHRFKNAESVCRFPFEKLKKCYVGHGLHVFVCCRGTQKVS